jgi:hypothetical protein
MTSPGIITNSSYAHKSAVNIKMPKFIAKLSPILILGMAMSVAIVDDRTVVAKERKFTCQNIAGTPTTVVSTPRGQIPTLRWLTSFGGKYRSTELRCQEVSARLDRFNHKGKLKYIRTGMANGYPVLCVDRETAMADCPADSLLLTLKRNADSALVLQQMLDLRARASGVAIDLSGENQLIIYRHGHAFVNLDRLVGVRD